ncbi:unnamed protein product [Mucor fragilis]
MFPCWTPPLLCRSAVNLTPLTHFLLHVLYHLLFILLDFAITFYLQQLTARGIYASFEIAHITFPRSLEGIPAFFNMRNIRLLLAVNKVFWQKCVISDKPTELAEKYQNATRFPTHPIIGN